MIRILSIIALLTGIACSSKAQTTDLQTDLSLKYLAQLAPAASVAPPVIILLHGYGSDEKDLFELRKSFPARYLVISVRAPYSAGPQGYQWFEPGKSDGSSPEVEKSRKLIMKFIGEVIRKYNADKKQVYLIGFSQGAMMSYEAGLTSPETIKGISVLSGRLFPTLRDKLKLTPELKQMKIFISHGTTDNRIPFTEGKSSADSLIKLGLKPEFHEYTGMGHSINEQVMIDLVRWLK
jgi:phospholipase/carboxylesterase